MPQFSSKTEENSCLFQVQQLFSKKHINAKDQSGLNTNISTRKIWNWGCSVWKREDSGKTLQQPFNTYRGLTRKTGTNSSTAFINRTGHNDFKLKEDRWRLDIRKKSFRRGVVKHHNRLPRKAVDTPFLETFKVRLDRALSNLIQLKMSLLIARGLDKVIFKDHLQPKLLYVTLNISDRKKHFTIITISSPFLHHLLEK